MFALWWGFILMFLLFIGWSYCFWKSVGSIRCFLFHLFSVCICECPVIIDVVGSCLGDLLTFVKQRSLRVKSFSRSLHLVSWYWFLQFTLTGIPHLILSRQQIAFYIWVPGAGYNHWQQIMIYVIFLCTGRFCALLGGQIYVPTLYYQDYWYC